MNRERVSSWMKEDGVWFIFGILWLLLGILVTGRASLIVFRPLFAVALYASGAVIAFGCGYILKKTYAVTKEPAKLFFGMGLQFLAIFWIGTSALAPMTLGQQTGMFLWAPHIGLFFATILFLSGSISRNQTQREYLWKNHEEVDQIMTGIVIALSFFLVTSPWGVRGMQVLEEGSLAQGEIILEILLGVLLLIAFMLEYHHSSFKGLSYNTLARGLVFLTVAHYGLLVTQPWSANWWVFQVAGYGTIMLLLVKLSDEYETQVNIASSVSAWKPVAGDSNIMPKSR